MFITFEAAGFGTLGWGDRKWQCLTGMAKESGPIIDAICNVYTLTLNFHSKESK